MREVGKSVRIYDWPKITYPHNVKIGDFTTINAGVVINGRGVRVSQYSILETGYLLPGKLPYEHDSKPITVGDGVWIASGAIILAGVFIGNNSIIAAGAVVTKDVPENSVAMGVPARFKKIR